MLAPPFDKSMSITPRLYYAVKGISGYMRILPEKTDQFAFDERFAPSYTCEELDDMPHGTNDPDWYYKHVFHELEEFAMHNQFESICESDDINEGMEHGEYIYYHGKIDDKVPFLYMYPPHTWVFPSRLIFYDPVIQISVNSDQKEIEIFEVNASIRNKFFLSPYALRISELTAMLRNSDRPRLDQ